jgi:hypothetical protein
VIRDEDVKLLHAHEKTGRPLGDEVDLGLTPPGYRMPPPFGGLGEEEVLGHSLVVGLGLTPPGYMMPPPIGGLGEEELVGTRSSLTWGLRRQAI